MQCLQISEIKRMCDDILKVYSAGRMLNSLTQSVEVGNTNVRTRKEI